MLNNEMRELVLTMLQQNLPPTYLFHDHRHTLYVLADAERIGKAEGVTDREMDLLLAAALWHDVGYIKAYKGHEYESCVLAQKYLPDFGFNNKEVDQICGMIMATMVPQDPHNKLEEILADADLAYLGTSDASELAHLLFMELQSINPHLTVTEWTNTQVSFLKTHQYFTDYCKSEFGPPKEAYLALQQNLL